MGEHARPVGAVTAALRAAIPSALAVVARRIGDFDDAEDAVQEAALEASIQWARSGLPSNPTGWIVTAAIRRAIDSARSEQARRDRERRVALLDVVQADAPQVDDSLSLFLMCCHPVLGRSAQVPLTLRAVGGLTTREIARGLQLEEATVAQRISRAKAALRRSGASFVLPGPEELEERVTAVLDVLGIIHTESHSATEGESLTRPALAREALRVARELLRVTPVDASWRGEVLGLVALMLLTNAREPARYDTYGEPVALADQDRSRWRGDLIAEGDALLREALASYPIGVFQLRAAIAAVHSTAATHQDTDWSEIVALYDLLRVLAPDPVTELARLVAWAEVVGPERALAAVEEVSGKAFGFRVTAVRAHLLDRAGRDARGAYREAAALATNEVERRWFEKRAAEPED